MENNFLSAIKTSDSISTRNYIVCAKKDPQAQKKNEAPENGVAQIMTLFLPYLKESISDNSYIQLQKKLALFLRNYKN